MLGTLIGVVWSVMGVGLLVVLALLLQMTRAQDETAAEASRQQFRGLLALQQQHLGAHVRDYAHWDAAVQHIPGVYDPEWWTNNAGAFVVEGFDLSFSLAVDGLNAMRLQAIASASERADPATLTPSLLALLSDARARRGRESTEVAATGIVTFNGQLHLATATTFVSDTGDIPNADPDAVLVFARELQGGILQTSSHIMGHGALEWLAEAPAAGTHEPLVLADGSRMGVVAWTPPAPGHALLYRMAPLIIGAFLLMALLLGLFRHRARRLAAAIHEEAEARRRSDERSRSILQAAGEGIFGVNDRGQVVFANPAALTMLGHDAGSFIGQQASDVFGCPTSDADTTPCPIERTLREGTPVSSDTEGFQRRDGSRFPVEYLVTPMEEMGERGAVVVFHDISRRRRSEEEIRYRANYDMLTGLPNRSLLVERLTQELRLARREGTRLGLLFVDLDHFKDINDAAGHEVGDLMLQQVAARLRHCVRDSDTVGRLGGDEFALLLPRLHDSQDAAAIADKVISTLADRFDLQGQEAWIGASVGITVFPGDGDTPSELLRHADLAMYKAKEAGRNDYRFYQSAMTEQVLQRRALEVELRRALQQGELLLHYQPIVALASGQTVHVEALLRWRHPVRGMIAPADFIPLAESSGLIVEIGSWVLDESCRQLAAWRQTGRDTAVAVNVSGRQIPRGLSLEQIRSTLARHGVAPTALCFELTESILLDPSEAIKNWLEGVRALGITLMIDDFGTGYSSLSYLKHFIVQALKVDRSFVSGVVDDPEDQALVRAILAMARSLGLAVVAEGVETDAQRAWLQAHGCEYAQGFLFGRPAEP